MPRMQAAARQQTAGVFFYIIGDELVYAAGKTDDLWSDIIDEHGTINAARVQEFEKSFGRAAEFLDLLEIRALLFHQFQGMGLEHFHRLDVDVAVSDHQMPVFCG